MVLNLSVEKRPTRRHAFKFFGIVIGAVALVYFLNSSMFLSSVRHGILPLPSDIGMFLFILICASPLVILLHFINERSFMCMKNSHFTIDEFRASIDYIFILQ